jgi:hypothetical protein
MTRSVFHTALGSCLSAALVVTLATGCGVQTSASSQAEAEQSLSGGVPLTFFYPDGTERTSNATCDSFAGQGTVAQYLADGKATTRAADLFGAGSVAVKRGDKTIIAKRSGRVITVEQADGLIITALTWNDQMTLATFQSGVGTPWRTRSCVPCRTARCSTATPVPRRPAASASRRSPRPPSSSEGSSSSASSSISAWTSAAKQRTSVRRGATAPRSSPATRWARTPRRREAAHRSDAG